MRKSYLCALAVSLSVFGGVVAVPSAAADGNISSTLTASYTFGTGQLTCDCTLFIVVDGADIVITLPEPPLGRTPEVVIMGENGGSYDLITPQGQVATDFTTRSSWVGHASTQKWHRSR
jgi:hypothetical protein